MEGSYLDISSSLSPPVLLAFKRAIASSSISEDMVDSENNAVQLWLGTMGNCEAQAKQNPLRGLDTRK